MPEDPGAEPAIEGSLPHGPGDEFNVEAGPPPSSLKADFESTQEFRSYFASEPDKNIRAARRMRIVAFAIFGALSVAFLWHLLRVLYSLFHDQQIVMFLAFGKDWHGLVFAAVVLVIFAAVPMTLVNALVRMISERGGEDDKAPELPLTPTLEFMKMLIQLTKTK